MKVTTERAAKC